MATLAAVRSALQARLLAAYAGQGVRIERVWPDSTKLPALVVRAAGGEYLQNFGHSQELYRFELHVIVSVGPGLEGAQDQLDQYLSADGTLSVRAALDADPSLGGVVHATFARRYRDYDTKTVNGVEVLGAVIDVEVHST